MQLRKLKSPESTTSQLSRHERILASYVLVVTPVPAGTPCAVDPNILVREGVLEQDEVPASAVVDCSGKCVSERQVRQRLGDRICDDGITPRPDDKPLIDLSCTLIPEFFIPEFVPTSTCTSITAKEELARCTLEEFFSFTQSRNRDGGDCTPEPEKSCMAQFGTAPDYKFCPGLASPSVCSLEPAPFGIQSPNFCSVSSSVCSFSATTGVLHPSGRGTCTDMCQRFDSTCVAALDNKTPGCTPTPKMPQRTDTCETPMQTAICICKGR